MKARRQIVDSLTGAVVPSTSPAAVDTGRVVVGRNTVVPHEDLDPTGDRFGIAASAVPGLRAETRKKPKAPLGRGQAIKTTMDSPAAALREFEDLNPQTFRAPGFDDVDIQDKANDFLDGIEVRSGKKHVRLNKTPTGQRLLQGKSGSTIVRGILKYLFAQPKTKRWRDVPWGTVTDFMGLVGDAMDDVVGEGGSGGGIVTPIAAGLDSPEVTVARAQEELGPAAAKKVVRQLRAEELRSLAERLEHAIETTGEECLSGAALKVARERLRQIRVWARRPDDVPAWSCVGDDNTGTVCSFPALVEDIKRIENGCEVEYDPRWPVERAERACAAGDEEGRTGVVGAPCEVRAAPTTAPARTGYKMFYGRLVKV